jgi:hypothetical protein
MKAGLAPNVIFSIGLLLNQSRHVPPLGMGLILALPATARGERRHMRPKPRLLPVTTETIPALKTGKADSPGRPFA